MAQHWEITEKKYGTVLTLLHDWDLDIANEFLGHIESHFDAADHTNYIFDLHLVHHIDSMVIGIIISISKRIKKNGGMVFILKPSKVVENLLEDIGLLSYFNVASSEEDIVKLLGSGS